MDRIWQALMVLFRIYQYACYAFVLVILGPVVLLYLFDVGLYLFRMMIYFIRFQVYLIRNRCIPETRIIHRTGGSYEWKMKEKGVEEECSSSNSSILSAFRGSRESLLDESGSVSSNYSLVGSSQSGARRLSTSRNDSFLTFDAAQISLLTPHAEICKLRRKKSKEIEVSLDRYDNQYLRAQAL